MSSVMALAARKDCGCVCAIAVDDGDVQRRRDFYRDAADDAMTVERVTVEQARTTLTFGDHGKTVDPCNEGTEKTPRSSTDAPLGHLDTAK